MKCSTGRKAVISMVLFLTLLSLLSLSAFADKLPQVTVKALYVSPFGNDENDGSISSPLATIQAAKERLKSLKDTVQEKYTVYLREGTYYVSEMLSFTTDDMQNVTYKAYNGEKAVISGAMPITGFTEETVNGVKAFVKQLDKSKTDWYFNSLFNDKTRLKTPRYPEAGYFTVASLNTDDSLWTEETTPWSFTTGQRSFNASLDDVSKEFCNQSDVIVRILHYWKDEMMYVTGFDPATGRVSLSRPSSMNIRDIDRYYFENVFEALNAPGEWYLDKQTAILYYVPFEGESADELTLYSSSAEALVAINGANGIGFEGIDFRDTAWRIPVPESYDWRKDNDIDALQAATDVKGVFRVSDADSITVKNCNFINIGSDAIKIERNVTNSSVESCYFENIGATGIFVGGDNVSAGTNGSTNNIKLVNNEIYKYGRIFFNAVGIHITYCDTAQVENNEIHDGYYTGISCGWVWGYSFHATRNISIKNNLIYDIGQGWLSDMGGIYMLGIQNGTVISGNVIHNVAADLGEGGYGGWGIYLDEGSSNMIIEKNLTYCCGSQGLNIHYGEGNIFRNNISAFNAEGQVSPGLRDETHITAVYYNNIYLTDNGAPIYIYMKDSSHFSDNNNLMWDYSNGKKLYFCYGSNLNEAVLKSYAELDGCINNPTFKDPMFVDAKSFNFKLSPDSPALETGFVEWDYTKAGTISGSTVGTLKTGGQTDIQQTSTLIPVKSAKLGNLFKMLFNKIYLLLWTYMDKTFSWFPLW